MRRCTDMQYVSPDEVAHDVKNQRILRRFLGLKSSKYNYKGMLCCITIAFNYFSEEHWVDDISKRLFPVMFLLFNIVYWSMVNNALTRQLNQPEENGFKRVAFDFEENLTKT